MIVVVAFGIAGVYAYNKMDSGFEHIRTELRESNDLFRDELREHNKRILAFEVEKQVQEELARREKAAKELANKSWFSMFYNNSSS